MGKVTQEIEAIAGRTHDFVGIEKYLKHKNNPPESCKWYKLQLWKQLFPLKKPKKHLDSEVGKIISKINKIFLFS